MANKLKYTDEQIVALIREHGSPKTIRKRTGININQDRYMRLKAQMTVPEASESDDAPARDRTGAEISLLDTVSAGGRHYRVTEIRGGRLTCVRVCPEFGTRLGARGAETLDARTVRRVNVARVTVYRERREANEC